MNSDELKIGAILSEAFEIFKKQPLFFILGAFILTLMNSIALGFLLIGPMYASLMKMASKARKGEELKFEHVFSGFENFGPIFGGGILYYLLLVISFSFCIIPGFFVGGLLLYFLPHMALGNGSIGEAFDFSKNESMKALLNHCLFFLVATLIGASGLILCGIGIVITFPIGMAMMTIAYEDRVATS